MDETAPALQDPTVFDRIFAARMKRERLRKGWRQEDLARALAGLGLDLHPSAIAKMEREPDQAKGIEPRAVKIGEAVVIAAALGLSLSKMLSDDDRGESHRELEKLRVERDVASHRVDDAIRQLDMRQAELAEYEKAYEAARQRYRQDLIREKFEMTEASERIDGKA